MTSFNLDFFFNAAPSGTIQEHNMRQVCTHAGHQAAWATKFHMVVPKTCGSLGCNLLHGILLAAGSLRQFLDFWGICGPLI